MAKLEDEEENSDIPSTSTSATKVSPSFFTNISNIDEADSLQKIDLLTKSVYEAMNGKTVVENQNIDLAEQLKNCHLQIERLSKIEEDFKDQVHLNQLVKIERAEAIAALKAEKKTVDE